MTRLPSLGPRGEGWFAIQLVLLWLIVATGFGANGAWTREARYATTVIAAILLLAGGVLVVRGVVDLGGAMTPLPRPRDGAPLVETGVYGLVRHPVYGGLVIGATGWSLLAASPAALACTVLLLLFFRLKSAREEAWLSERHPRYEAYRARTKRMIPFVW